MKKVLRILLWIVGIFLALVIIAAIGIQLFFPKEKAKAYAIKEGSAALGRPLTIDDIDVSFWGGLGIKLMNVGIANPEGFGDGTFLTAENIDVKLQFLPLITSDVRVDKLVINKPQVELIKKPDGSNNYTFAVVDTTLPPKTAEKIPAEAKPATAAVSFDRFEINDGTITYRDDSSKMSVNLNEVQLTTTLKNPRENYFVSAGHLQVGEMIYTSEQPYPPYALDVTYRLNYDVNKDILALEQTNLEINGIRLKLTGNVEQVTGDMLARINIQSDRVTAADLFKLLPPENLETVKDFTIDGNFALDVDLAYNSVDTANPYDYSGSANLTDMAMSKKGIDGQLKIKKALVDFKPNNLRFTIEEGSFDGKPIRGHLLVEDFENPVVNGELGGNFNLVFLEPFIPAENNQKIAGETSFDIKFSGLINEPKDMNFNGNLKVTEGTYSSDLLPEPVDKIGLDVYFERDLVKINNLVGSTPSGNLQLTGRINNLIPYFLADSVHAKKYMPSFDLKLKGGFNLALLNRFLPEKGKPELKGRFDTDMALSGKTSDLSTVRIKGDLAVKEASYVDSLLPEPVENFDADLQFNSDDIVVKKFKVNFTSSDVAVMGQILNPFPYLLPVEGIDRDKIKRPLFKFNLTSNRFDVDKLFPEAVPASGAVAEGKPVDSVSMLLVPDIDAEGGFKIDSLIYSQVEFSNITGRIEYYNRKFRVHEVNGNVYTGKVTGETTIDLSDFNNPKYTGEFYGQKVEVNDFMKRFMPVHDFLYGQIDIKGKYNAVGWEPEQFINSLNMDGLGMMREGKVVTKGAVYKVISSLAEKTGETFNKEQPLKKLESNFVVEDGKVKLDQFQTKLGDLGDISLDGWYGLDLSSLNYSGTILLSEDVTSNMLKQGGVIGGLAGLLGGGGDKKRVPLPFKVTGTVDKPQIELDYDAMMKSAGEGLKEDAKGLFKDLFKK